MENSTETGGYEESYYIVLQKLKGARREQMSNEFHGFHSSQKSNEKLKIGKAQ